MKTNICSIMLAAALLLSFNVSAVAQTTHSHAKVSLYAPSEMAVMAHLESMLRSKDEATRIAALQDINLLASAQQRGTTKTLRLNVGTINFKWQADLAPLAPDLLMAYRTSSQPGMRIMAANALYQIGDEASLEQLITLNDFERSRHVKQHTNRMLSRYFTDKYPELSSSKSINHSKIKKAQRRAQRAG